MTDIRKVNKRIIVGKRFFFCKATGGEKEPLTDHDRLRRTVISPGTDLAFSRATGICGSGRDEREADAE